MSRFMQSRRHIYLDELLCHKGRCSQLEAMCPCSTSTSSSSLPMFYRCETCLHSPEMCRTCIVSTHQNLPFCDLKVSTTLPCIPVSRLTQLQLWNGDYWQDMALFDINITLAIQLGHDGGTCPVPAADTSTMIVVDITGVHRIWVRFCACQKTERYIQLLRAKMYPSSENRPRSAWTFDFLDNYVKISLQGKVSLYDFYNAVLHRSHNTATSDTLVCV
jgi:hypothetical protein